MSESGLSEDIMKYSYATKRMTNYEYQRNVLLGLNGVLLVILLIMSLSLFFKKERIVVLPPEVRREFWVEGNRFSSEYLEEMATYFLHLSLDVNQETLNYNTRVLMRYADVSTCNYLREKFAKDIKKLKSNNASTSFDVKELTVYPEQNTVRAKGVLNRYCGSKCINSSKEIYEVRFKTYRGRLFFKKIKKIEAKHED